MGDANIDWIVTFELKRVNADGSENVEQYREVVYASKERWECPQCQRLNFIQPDKDDPSFDPKVCEGCGHTMRELPEPLFEDDAWWIVCAKCDKPIIAADFGQHLMLHIQIPQDSDTVGGTYI